MRQFYASCQKTKYALTFYESHHPYHPQNLPVLVCWGLLLDLLTGLSRQTWAQCFQPAANYPVGTTSRSVAVADFNSDGKPDLATANILSSVVSVLLGDGQGNFGPEKDFGTQSGPRAVAVADLNGDGKPDLVTANNTGLSLSVLLNCTTAPSLSLATSATPNPICAGSSTQLSVAASGGTAPCSYTWAAPAGITLSVTSTNVVPASVDESLSGPQTISVTSAIPYSVTLADINGCTASTSFVVGADQTVPTVSISPNSATLTCANPSVSLAADAAWRSAQRDGHQFRNGDGHRSAGFDCEHYVYVACD
ncbi:hypothetical protein GCM10027592_01230 [Spirosoma flavus]